MLSSNWHWGIEDMSTETSSNIVCRKLHTHGRASGVSTSKSEFDRRRSLVLPTLPPTPIRASSTPNPPNPAMFQVVNQDATSLAHGFVPRVVPDFRSNNGFVRNSAIRSTLGKGASNTPSVRLVDPVRHVSALGTDTMGSPLLPPPPALDLGSARKPISDLLKIAKYMDDRGGDNIDDQEKDAAVALLVLRECNRQLSEISMGWSHFGVVPLCDFVVAQRKCQTMLNSIETLKELKIRARNFGVAYNVDFRNAQQVARPVKEKNVKFREEKLKSSRCSSVVSVVNVPPSPSIKGKAVTPRSSSVSSEKTLTCSPLSSDRSTPSPVTLGSSSKSNTYSPFQSTAQREKIFVPFSGQGRGPNGKIGKTSKSGKNRNAHMRCLHCSSTETPEWRKGPGGPTTLCNACGLFYKKLIKKFGEEVAKSIMKSRQIENPQDRKIPQFAGV